MQVTPKRFVVYSDSSGILLGFETMESQLWSKFYTGKVDSAPTFLTQADVDEYVSVNSSSGIPESRLVEVFPDRPDNRASKDACANAQLPRW